MLLDNLIVSSGGGAEGEDIDERIDCDGNCDAGQRQGVVDHGEGADDLG